MFIGSCVVRQLVAQQRVRVVNVDALTYAGNMDSLDSILGDPLHVFVRCDIGDTPRMEALVAEYRPRTIMNLAAESHVDRSIDGPADFVQTNVVGTFRLLEVARRYWSELTPSEGDATGPSFWSSSSPEDGAPR